MTYRIGYLRFTLWFVGLSLAIPLILTAVRMAFGLDLNSAATAIIPMMIGALQEGTAFGKAEKRKPTGPEAWSISLRLTGIAILINMIVAGVFLAVSGADVFATLGLGWLLGLVLFFGVIFWCLGRFFMGLGAGTALKANATEGPQT